jgi:hypothetical protein
MTETAAAKPTCYDQLFESVRTGWDAHDKTCTSLADLWLGRKGGVTCLGDIGDCSRCGVTFYWEGLTDINWRSGEPRTDSDYRCECCIRADTTKPAAPPDPDEDDPECE